MKKICVVALIVIASMAKQSLAQNKKVLLEEFTGAPCGNCPMGGHDVDSMLTKYPVNLIAVSLHWYRWPYQDSMDFGCADTLGDTYCTSAPSAAIDRFNTVSTSTDVSLPIGYWDAAIQARFAITPVLSLTVTPSWNSITRNITAQLDVSILSNMVTGDYRIGLYVIEDSVTGVGSGYDQENYYNTTVGSPFYGMGNPIVGYVHRHVVRAILPSAWGLTGIIPSTPMIGQNFPHIFNYTLPSTYNENRVSLVAFVYKFSSNHQTDEVLNVNDAKLISVTIHVAEIKNDKKILIFPNPSNGSFNIQLSNYENTSIEVYNAIGECVHRQIVKSSNSQIDVSDLAEGIYNISISSNEGIVNKRVVITK